jgi:hypothetical protein
MIRGKTVALVVCARILAGLQAGGMTICVNSTRLPFPISETDRDQKSAIIS